MRLPDLQQRVLRVPAGVRYMLGSALAFATMSWLVKLAGRALPSQEIVLVRSAILLVSSYLLVRRAGISPWGRQRRLLLLRGLLGFGALSCFFFGLTRLPLAEATVIQYTNPIFTVVFAAVFLRERATPQVMVGIAVSLAGVVLVTRPAGLGLPASLDTTGLLVALLGAVISGGVYTLVRRLKGEHPLVVIFYFPLVATPATIPFLLIDAVWPTAGQWLVLLGLGLASQAGQICLTRGLALEPAGRAMSVAYAQVLFAAIYGLAAFGEVPDGQTIAGALLVVVGIAVALRGRGHEMASPDRGGEN
jgi:drug/metabolite transporter (DMT)-like permease